MTILQSYTTQMVLLGTALLGLASGIAGTFAVLRKEASSVTVSPTRHCLV